MNKKKWMKFLIWLFLVFLMPGYAYSASYNNEIMLTNNLHQSTSGPGEDHLNYAINANTSGDGTYVVWASPDPYPEPNETGSEIFVFDGNSIIQITDNLFDDKEPRINASGNIVWIGKIDSDYEVFLRTGETTKQITNNIRNEITPKINANGYLAWTGYQGPELPENLEIFLYDGISIQNISNRSGYSDMLPKLNAGGQVAWTGQVLKSDGIGTAGEVYLYSFGTKKNISNRRDYEDASGGINENGYVVFSGNYITDPEIFLYNGSNKIQITNNGNIYEDEGPCINANNHLVWRGRSNSDTNK